MADNCPRSAQAFPSIRGVARAFLAIALLSGQASTTQAQSSTMDLEIREATLFLDQTARRERTGAAPTGNPPFENNVATAGFVFAAGLTEPRYSATIRFSGFAASTDDNVSTSLKLNQLSFSAPVTDACFISLGKRIVAWDVSYFVQPVGFFQNVPRIGDLEDRRGLLQGLPLGFVSCSAENELTYELVASAYSETDTQRPAQVAARIAGIAGTTNYSVLLRHNELGFNGLGWTLSSLLSDSLELHSSGLFDVENQDREEKTLQFLVGASWNPTPKISLLLEAWHNQSGLTAEEWDALRQTDTVNPRALQKLGRLQDAGSYLRRNYVAGRASSALSAELAFTPSVGFVYGADDNSALYFINLQYQISKRLLVTLGASRFAGTTQSEFGSSRTQSEITLSLFGFLN
jgi:hypothetical protein